MPSQLRRDSQGSASTPRVSLSVLNASGGPDRHVRIWLLAAVVQRQRVTYYRVAGRLLASGQTWEVQRRYSEFLALRDTLLAFFTNAQTTCPGCLNYMHAIETCAFPKKKWFGSNSTKVVQTRILALRGFINLLASWAFSTAPKCPTCGGDAFALVRNFVVEDARAIGNSDLNAIRHSFVASTFVEALGSSGRSSVSMARQRTSHGVLRTQSSDDVIRARDAQTTAMSLPPRRNTYDLAEWEHDPNHDHDHDYDAFHDYMGPHRSGTQRTGPPVPAPAPSSDRKQRQEHRHQDEELHDAVKTQGRSQNGKMASRSRSDQDVLTAKPASNPRRRPNRQEWQPSPPSDAVSASELQLSDLSAGPTSRPKHDSIPLNSNSRPHVRRSASLSTSSSDDDDEELQFTGIVTDASAPRRGRPKTASGEGLWEPWELAQAH